MFKVRELVQFTIIGDKVLIETILDKLEVEIRAIFQISLKHNKGVVKLVPGSGKGRCFCDTPLQTSIEVIKVRNLLKKLKADFREDVVLFIEYDCICKLQKIINACEVDTLASYSAEYNVMIYEVSCNETVMKALNTHAPSLDL